MKIYLDTNLMLSSVDTEEFTQDSVGYNIIKLYIPDSVVSGYDSFVAYYGAILPNSRKVGYFGMVGYDSSDTDYESGYTHYKATLESMVVSVPGKVALGFQLHMSHTGDTYVTKKNSAVVMFIVRDSVAINNDIIILDEDETPNVLKSYKNLFETAMLTYVTQANLATSVTTNSLTANNSATFNGTSEFNGESTFYDDIAVNSSDIVQTNGGYSTNGNVEANSFSIGGVDLNNYIDNLTSQLMVSEVVATYAALQAVDTTDLNSGVRYAVMSDTNYDDNPTIYAWNGSSWVYKGTFEWSDYLDGKFATLEDTVTNRLDAQDASIASLASATPTIFDTAANILALTANGGVAVGTDDGYIYVWDSDNSVYASSGLLYQATGIQNGSVIESSLRDTMAKHVTELSFTFTVGNITSTGDVGNATNQAKTNIIWLYSGTIIDLTGISASGYRITRLGRYSKNTISSTYAENILTQNMRSYTVVTSGWYVIQCNCYEQTVTQDTLDILNTMVRIIYTDNYITYNNKTYKEINGFNYTWISGYIAPNGDVRFFLGGNNNYMSRVIYKNEFNYIKITIKDGFTLNFAKYSGGSFIGRNSSWITEGNTVYISNDNDVVLLLGTSASGSGETLENMLLGYEIYINTNNDLSIKENEKQTDFISKIKACDFDGRNAHISIDDVYLMLYELTTNTPASIFDNSKFAYLKTLHETYGVVFTLNCFNFYSGLPAYDIANVPSTWTSEFQSNKDWLRFAFHAKDNTTDYDNDSTLVTDYQYFLAAVYSFTGSYDCIDHITRLGYFHGTQEQLKKVSKIDNGIRGLLCADDSRISYSLDVNENNFIINNGKYYDIQNEIMYFRTLLRMDSNGTTAIINEINGNIKYTKYVELFFHEYLIADSGLKAILEGMCSYINSNGYHNWFLDDIFNFD